MALSIPVLLGSVRTARAGDRVARYVCDQLRAHGHAPTLVDPAELDLPLLDRMAKEYDGDPPEPLGRLADLYRSADAFVVVSAEYNHLPPPALVNLLDYFLEAYFWRPAGIVTYSAGSFGGVRAGVHLRDLLSELGMVSVPTALAFPSIRSTFDGDGTPAEAQAAAFAKRTGRFCAELAWYAEALAARRASGTPY